MPDGRPQSDQLGRRLPLEDDSPESRTAPPEQQLAAWFAAMAQRLEVSCAASLLTWLLTMWPAMPVAWVCDVHKRCLRWAVLPEAAHEAARHMRRRMLSVPEADKHDAFEHFLRTRLLAFCQDAMPVEGEPHVSRAELVDNAKTLLNGLGPVAWDGAPHGEGAA